MSKSDKTMLDKLKGYVISNEGFMELRKKVKTDLKIDGTDLFKEVLEQNGKHHWFLTRYIMEKKKLLRLEQLQRKVKSNLYFKYRLGKKNIEGGEYILTNPKEINEVINQDDEYISIGEIIVHQEVVVDYLEYALGMFKDRKWLIEDAIKIRKLEAEG